MSNLHLFFSVFLWIAPISTCVALEKEGVQISVNSVPAQQNHHELQAKLEQLQMALQKKEHQLAALQNLDYDNLSPKQALDFLWKMRELG